MAKAVDHWSELASTYQERGIALFLGAGVSVGLNIPNWDRLLDQLIDDLIPASEKLSLASLMSAGFSLPAVAALLERKAGGPEAFAKRVRKVLYAEPTRRFGVSKRGIPAASVEAFLQFVRKGNVTLAAAAALCVTPNGKSAIRNPRVHAVVNFNFDDLFSLYTRKTYHDRIFRNTERASKSALPMRYTSYYYPHGRLGLSPESKSDAESSDLLVFTEQSFFDFYNRPNALFNYTLMFLLREYHCLFLGVSFRDENLRRLLHYSACERREHYLKEKGGDPAQRSSKGVPYGEQANQRILRHYAVFRQSEFAGALQHHWTESLAPLGVNPLWISAWPELPSRLGTVYGREWSSVYPHL